MMRREFIALLGGAAAWPLGARAQEAARMRRIGVLMSTAADDTLPAGLQLSLFVHARHVSARFANGAQRAAVFGRQGAV